MFAAGYDKPERLRKPTGRPNGRPPGTPQSEATRAKISAAMTGRVITDQWRQRMRDGQRRRIAREREASHAAS
jgi:hypothetical protein